MSGADDSDGGKDDGRFYCPFPDCKRSFAELWRLKVHYRAASDIRGSGKERGHGLELGFCPKCNKELKAGKHHVGCKSAGPRVPPKKIRKITPEPITLAQHDMSPATSMASMDEPHSPAAEGMHFPAVNDQTFTLRQLLSLPNAAAEGPRQHSAPPLLRTAGPLGSEQAILRTLHPHQAPPEDLAMGQDPHMAAHIPPPVMPPQSPLAQAPQESGLPVRASQDLQTVWNMLLSQNAAQQHLHRLFSSLPQGGQPDGFLPSDYQPEVLAQPDPVDLVLQQHLLALRDSGQLQSLRMPPGWEQLPQCDSLTALLAQPPPPSQDPNADMVFRPPPPDFYPEDPHTQTAEDRAPLSISVPRGSRSSPAGSPNFTSLYGPEFRLKPSLPDDPQQSPGCSAEPCQSPQAMQTSPLSSRGQDPTHLSQPEAPSLQHLVQLQQQARVQQLQREGQPQQPGEPEQPRSQFQGDALLRGLGSGWAGLGLQLPQQPLRGPGQKKNSFANPFAEFQDSSEGLFADLFARGSFGTAPSCRPLRSAPAAAGPHPSPQDSWTKDAAMRSAPSDSLVAAQAPASDWTIPEERPADKPLPPGGPSFAFLPPLSDTCSYSLGLENLMQQAAPLVQAPVLADALNASVYPAPWSSA